MDALNQIQIDAENDLLKLATANFAFKTVSVINEVVKALGDEVNEPTPYEIEMISSLALCNVITFTKQLKQTYQQICPAEAPQELADRIYSLFQ